MIITVPYDAQAAIQEFLLDRPVETPDDVRDKLKEYIRPGYNPVEASINIAELIYAKREQLHIELLSIGADIAAMCAKWEFGDMAGANGRGNAIAFTIRKMPGVMKPLKTSYKAPEPLPEFMPQPEPEELGAGEGLPPGSEPAA